MYHLRLSVFFILAGIPFGDPATPPPAPLWNDMMVKHMWNAVPAHWESLGHPPIGTTIDLHIALKPQNESALIDALYEVSDPRLPTYGAHLSREQVAELVAPHPDTLGLIYSWLEHGGVSSSISMAHGGSWLTVTGVPVSQANVILGASYQLYQHTGTNHTILRTVSYSLPAALHEHVQTVAPTTHFSPARTLQQTLRKRSRAEAVTNATSGALLSGRASDKEVTPGFLRWLYNTQTYVPAATDRNVLGIAGYDGESPSLEDLAAFMSDYRIDAQDVTFTVVQVNGGKYDPSHPGLEASMNIQYTEGMAYPTPHVFYSIGSENMWSISTLEPTPDDSDFVWLIYLLSQPSIPQTISISYGNYEEDLLLEYARTICYLFAHLGLRGVSVLHSTGNSGVGKGDCKDSSGKVQFKPFFPASCPWVTSVGGTTSHNPEVAASISGGGFSTHFPRPKYQDRAVSSFLNRIGKEMYAGLYNPDGRGIPDIAAQALKFKTVVGGHVSPLSGISCAVPTVAGVISLLNDNLLARGKAPLGFLNLWLYSPGFTGLNDIASGSNPGCNTDGFPAVVGWDPVTGLGTPDFVKLQQRLATVAPHSFMPSDLTEPD